MTALRFSGHRLRCAIVVFFSLLVAGVSCVSGADGCPESAKSSAWHVVTIDGAQIMVASCRGVVNYESVGLGVAEDVVVAEAADFWVSREARDSGNGIESIRVFALPSITCSEFVMESPAASVVSVGCHPGRIVQLDKPPVHMGIYVKMLIRIDVGNDLGLVAVIGREASASTIAEAIAILESAVAIEEQ